MSNPADLTLLAASGTSRQWRGRELNSQSRGYEPQPGTSPPRTETDEKDSNLLLPMGGSIPQRVFYLSRDSLGSIQAVATPWH